MLPLAGIRIVTLEQFVAGPLATMWLADAGAQVIKVEDPVGGDTSRLVAPMKADEAGVDHSLSFLRMNRGKQSVCIDVKSPRGNEILVQLISSSDVFFTNMSPGALKRLGLDYESLAEKIDPHVIYASVSGYGHLDLLRGPFSGQPAFDTIAEAMAGLMWRPEGAVKEPLYCGFPAVDLFSGVAAALGVTLSLAARDRSPSPRRMDVAMYDCGLVLNELALILAGATDASASSGHPGHAMAAPFGVYRATDGFVSIGVLGERIWERFSEAIGRSDLIGAPGYTSGFERAKRAMELNAIVSDWIGSLSVDEAIAILLEAQVPVGPVQREAAILASEQTAARRMMVDVDDAGWGTVQVVGNPIKSEVMGVDRKASPAPELGQQTDQILREVGLDSETLQELRDLRAGGVSISRGFGR